MWDLKQIGCVQPSDVVFCVYWTPYKQKKVSGDFKQRAVLGASDTIFWDTKRLRAPVREQC